MRKILILILIITTNYGYSQYSEDIVESKYSKNYNYQNFPIIKDSIKKKGVYKTLDEFRDNNPSIKLEFEIVSELSKYKPDVFSEPFYLTSYKINVPKKEGRKFGSVFGFCDGKKVYITNSEEGSASINDFNFRELNYIGRYCYYDAVIISYNMQFSLPYQDINIIDINAGVIKHLTKGLLIEIISDKPYLFEKFKKEENKNSKRKEYLLEYLKN